MNTKWPCHSKPKAEWCDRHGPGDFMGHTCRTIARVNAKTRLYDAEREFRRAENHLHEANIKLEKAREAMAVVYK